MSCNYYLLSGLRRNSKTLNLLVNGKLVRNFPDISSIDLQTLNIPYHDVKEILKEYNPNTNLTGMFYNASYPHKDHKIKTYSAIFNYSNKTDYYTDNLREFAEQRNYKKNHKQKIELDQDKKFGEYIRTLMYYVLNLHDNRIIAYDSMISQKMKSIISGKHNEYNGISVENYINMNINIIKSLLSGYTELRNLTFEYISIIENTNSCTRTDLNYAKNWSNIGMIPTEPQIYKKNDEIIEYNQPTIFDYYQEQKVNIKK